MPRLNERSNQFQIFGRIRRRTIPLNAGQKIPFDTIHRRFNRRQKVFLSFAETWIFSRFRNLFHELLNHDWDAHDGMAETDAISTV